MATVTSKLSVFRSLLCAYCLLVLGCSSPQDPVSFTVAPFVQAPEGATAFYDRDVQRIFNRSCTGGCHEPGGTGEAQSDLVLTAEVSYAELFEPSASKNGPHVIPRDPNNSLLIWKLEGKDPTGRAVFGDPMPLGRPSLSRAEINAIRAWIQEGAVRSLAPPVPPSVLAAVSLDSVSVEVSFSEEVDRASAEAAGNYTFTGEGVPQVVSARLEAPDRVRLTTSPQTAGVPYILVVRGVRDLTGDTIVEGEGDQATFRFTPTISFARHLQPMFNASCAFVGCHSASEQFPPGAGLVLDEGQARANLVDKPSQQQAALNRVKPKEPDASYLIRKLEGAGGISGDRMPQGGPFFSPAEIQRFRLWVEQGAEDN